MMKKKRSESNAVLMSPFSEGTIELEFARRSDDIRQELAEIVSVKEEARQAPHQTSCPHRSINAILLRQWHGDGEWLTGHVTGRGTRSHPRDRAVQERAYFSATGDPSNDSFWSRRQDIHDVAGSSRTTAVSDEDVRTTQGRVRQRRLVRHE